MARTRNPRGGRATEPGRRDTENTASGRSTGAKGQAGCPSAILTLGYVHVGFKRIIPVPIDSAIRVRARPATLLVPRTGELANRVNWAATEAKDVSDLETSTAESLAFLEFDA